MALPQKEILSQQTSSISQKPSGFLSSESNNLYALAAIFTASLIYYLSYSSYGYSESDWGGIVVAAERFLQGDIFYRDVSIVYTPGIYLYTALAFKIFGVKLWSATAAWGLIRAFNCVLIYLLGTNFFPRKIGLLLPLILWIIPGPIHKSFLIFFCLLHLLILLRLLAANNKRFYLFAGLVAGVSFIFRLDLLFSLVIPLLLVEFLKFLDPVNNVTRKLQVTATIKNLAVFSAGIVIAISPLALYLYFNSALIEAVNQTLYFLGTAKSRLFLLPPLTDILSWNIWDFSNYAVIFIPLGIYSLLLVELVKKTRAGQFSHADKMLLVFFIYGLLSLHQILRWPWAGRLYQILPPFIIADIYLIMRYYVNRDKLSVKKPHFIFSGVLAVTNFTLLSLIIGSLAMSDMYTNNSILIRLTNTTLLSPRKASVYTTREEAENVHKIINIIEAETEADEYIYIVQYYPMYYFITGRKNATKYYFIEAYVYSEEKQLEVVKELEDKKVKFIISGPNHPETPEAVILNEYLNKYFTIIEKVGKKLIYKKIDSITPFRKST